MDISSAEYRKHNEMRMALETPYRLASPVKRTVFYFAVFVLATLLFTWVFTLDFNWGVSDDVKQILFMAAFLAAGVAHVFFLPKWLPHLYKQKGQSWFLYSLILSILIGVVVFVTSVIAGIQHVWLAGICVSVFFLPVAVQTAWLYFDFIVPEKYEDYTPWFMPAEIKEDKMTAVFLKSLPVVIRVKKNYFDVSDQAFRVTVAGRLTLGRMFHEFVLEKKAENNALQTEPEDSGKFAWRFLLHRAFSTRLLDAELTLIQNDVKPRDTIMAERVKID